MRVLREVIGALVLALFFTGAVRAQFVDGIQAVVHETSHLDLLASTEVSGLLTQWLSQGSVVTPKAPSPAAAPSPRASAQGEGAVHRA